MSETIAQQFCHEQCALMGEPPCFEIDRRYLREWSPCDQCAGAVTVHEAATARLRADLEKAKAALKYIQRVARSDDGSRTFDDTIRDLMVIDDQARAILAKLEGEEQP